MPQGRSCASCERVTQAAVSPVLHRTPLLCYSHRLRRRATGKSAARPHIITVFSFSASACRRAACASCASCACAGAVPPPLAVAVSPASEAAPASVLRPGVAAGAGLGTCVPSVAASEEPGPRLRAMATRNVRPPWNLEPFNLLTAVAASSRRALHTHAHINQHTAPWTCHDMLPQAACACATDNWTNPKPREAPVRRSCAPTNEHTLPSASGTRPAVVGKPSGVRRTHGGRCNPP